MQILDRKQQRPSQEAGVTTEPSKGYVQNAKDSVNEMTGGETIEQGETAENRARSFDYKILQYPSDLARNSRHPYWMTFYINKQELSSFKEGSSRAAFDSGDSAGLSAAQHHANQAPVLNRNVKGTGIGFGRKTQRTAMVIRLFIPDTLAWGFTNSFRDASLSGIPFTAAAQAGASLPGALSDSMTAIKGGGGLMGVLSSLASSKENRSVLGAGIETLEPLIGSDNVQLGLSAIGIAVNPQIDVIYGSPELRTFNFDFLFAPRDGQEAQSVSDIIKEFKFHSAPELLGGGIGIGRYFVPPSEFDIEFSTPSMGKISTCVLQNLTVDYAPSGVAFYSDGRPVGTRLTLQFKELEFITKDLVNRGY